MKITLKKFIPAVVILFALAPALTAQDFDFKALDKLAASAKSATNVTLNGGLLKLASAFLGSDGDSDAAAIKSLVSRMKGIYVRAYEFEKPGQYSEADVAPLRSMLQQPKWQAVVDVRENKEWTQVYLLQVSDSKLGGVAVVSTEPTRLTVVYVDGDINVDDLVKLSGSMGIPDLSGITGNRTGDSKADNKSRKKSNK